MNLMDVYANVLPTFVADGQIRKSYKGEGTIHLSQVTSASTVSPTIPPEARYVTS